MKYRSQEKGFTLVEMLVAVAILSILLAVVPASMSDARKNARDNMRVSTLEQLSLMMRLYVEEYGPDINCAAGIQIKEGGVPVGAGVIGNGTCTDGAQILDFLRKQMGELPEDPLGDNDDHFYYYDDHNCSSSGQSMMVFASEMESMQSNVLEVCDRKSDADGKYTEPYIIILPFVE
tara:strand:- start:393 stop:923 length:531 start_codon:yes stop_codon:yes gene_type:complete